MSGNTSFTNFDNSGNSTIVTDYEELYQLNVLEISCYSFLFLVGAPANFIIIYHIFKNTAYKRTRNEFLLSNLVIADTIVTCLMIPSEIAWRISISWVYGNLPCKIFQFYRALGIYSSSLILVVISIDRFIAVIYPFKYTSCGGLIQKCVIIAWAASILASLPQVVLFKVQAHPYVENYFQCVALDVFKEEWHQKMYNIFSLCVVYLFPLLIILICYTVICIKLFYNSKCLFSLKDTIDQCLRFCCAENPITSNAEQISSDAESFELSQPVRTPSQSLTAKRQKIQSRVLREAFIIILAFIICWSPYVLAVLWYQIDPTSARQLNENLQAILFMFAVSNSCVNPWIYGKGFVFRSL